MNGMKRKAERKRQAKQFTPDGLPRNANDYSVDDWRTIHTHLEAIKREIAARHRRKP